MLRDLKGEMIVYPCQSSAREIRDIYSNDIDRHIGYLEAHIRTATGEQHDAIVYASEYEFDPSYPEAVRFITERLMRSIGVNCVEYKYKNGETVFGTINATTPEEYVKYRYAGGMPNQYIEECIKKRAKREKRSKEERGVLYVPSVATLTKHLDRIYMRQVYSDIIPVKSPYSLYQDLFLNRFVSFVYEHTILTFALIIIAVPVFAFIAAWLAAIFVGGRLNLPF